MMVSRLYIKVISATVIQFPTYDVFHLEISLMKILFMQPRNNNLLYYYFLLKMIIEIGILLCPDNIFETD